VDVTVGNFKVTLEEEVEAALKLVALDVEEEVDEEEDEEDERAEDELVRTGAVDG